MKNLITDVNVHVQRGTCTTSGQQEPSQIFIQSMDLSHVSLVKAVISETALYTFEAKRSSYQIGMNLNHLSKVLACADDDDRVVMLYSKSPEPDLCWVHIHMYSCADEGSLLSVTRDPQVHVSMKYGHIDPIREKYFKFPVLFVDDVSVGIPSYQPGCTLVMPSVLLLRITEDLCRFADTLDISVHLHFDHDDDDDDDGKRHTGYKVVCSSMYGPDAGGRHEFYAGGPHDDQSKIRVDVRDRSLLPLDDATPVISLSFASKYLQAFAQAYHVSDDVILHLRDDAPIELLYQDPGSMASISYHLAPRIAD